MRASSGGHHAFPRLAEVTSHQVETVARDIRGTVVGFWTPAIYQGIAVAGLHLHFLSEDRSIGGHVLDLAAQSGDLHVAAFARFDLHLPTDDLFLRTELTHAEDHRIVAVEGGVAVSADDRPDTPSEAGAHLVRRDAESLEQVRARRLTSRASSASSTPTSSPPLLPPCCR